VETLRGPRGTQVQLKIRRIGVDQLIPFKITRDEIHIRAVPASYMLEGGIGYAELSVFSESSTDELRAAVENLRKQGAKGVIIDLRNNPGGLLDQGVSVSDLFLDKGKMVVETRSRVSNQNTKAYTVDGDDFPGLQIVVLVGQFSASAAEILAGALQDHDRALVIGRTTYGKGSVQQVFPLSNQNYLKMTTARWYTPAGRSIQKPYGIDANHATTDDSAEPADRDATPNDSTKKPAYKTDAGRTVYGGGGIHPDIVVVDSLSTAESKLVDALGKNLGKYPEVRFRYAVRFVREMEKRRAGTEQPDLKPGFAVTQEMLNEFYVMLQQSGVTVDRNLYNNASSWVTTQLAFEISRAKWGTQEANRRINAESPEVQVAANLLRQSNSTKSLFSSADAYNAQEKMKENLARTSGARR
jgi:carboxyl-terminal processing protease